jgi:hypothetical protein
MNPERWQQVKGVRESVLELAPSERTAFLDQACDGDHALRQEVESLLASEDGLAPEERLNSKLSGSYNRTRDGKRNHGSRLALPRTSWR